MSRGRRRTVRVLIVLGSVLAFISAFAIWVERQAFNTDDWVSTSDKLIQNQTIRSTLADYLVDQLYANVDVEKELKEILPGETKELAGPVSGGLRSVAGDGAEKLLETNTAQELWKDANRTAHEQLVAVLENKKEAVSTENGDVKLQLGSLVSNLADQVGIGASLAEKLPADAAEVTILRSDQLKTAQNIARAVKGLAIILSLLTFIAFGAAIYLSRDERWVTVLFCGIGLIAAGFAVIVAREVAGGIVVGQLVTEDSIRPAADEAWGISTWIMASIATTVIVIGVFFGIAGWLASPTGRRPLDPQGDGAGPARVPGLRLRRAWRSSSGSISSAHRPRTCARSSPPSPSPASPPTASTSCADKPKANSRGSPTTTSSGTRATGSSGR